MSTSGRDRVSYPDPPDENVARKKERLDSTIVKLKGKVSSFVDEHHKEKRSKLRVNTKNNVKSRSEYSTSSNAESSDEEQTEGSFRIIAKADILNAYYCMWENTSNVCWLDASMALLAHNQTLRYQANINSSAQIFKVIKYYNEAICTLNDQNHEETVEDKLNQAKMYLKTVQDISLKYLQPILKYKEGEPESAFCSLFNFICEDKNVRKYFEVSFKQSFYCEKCGRSRVTNQTKPIITLSNVSSFHPTSPTAIGECPYCKEPEQKRQITYKTLPPCLIFHFERGAGKGEVRQLDFTFNGREYKVTGIMTLEKGNEITTMNHFISWVRDPSSDFWLECNDLNPEVLNFTAVPLEFISMYDICIIMYEAFDELGTIEIETPLNKSSESLNDEDDANIPFIDLSQDTEELGCDQNNPKTGSFTVERGERHTKTTDEIDCPEIDFLKSISEGTEKSSENSVVDMNPLKWQFSSDVQKMEMLKDNSGNNITCTGEHLLKTNEFLLKESEKIPSHKATKNVSLQDTLSPRYTEMIMKLAKQNDAMDANKSSNIEKKFELFQDSELQNQTTLPIVVGVSYTSQIDPVIKMDNCQSLSMEFPSEGKEIINHSNLCLENGFASIEKNHTITKTVLDHNESSTSKLIESETEDTKCFTENHFVEKSNSMIKSMPNLDEILSFQGNVISECNKILFGDTKNESDLSIKESIKDKHSAKDHKKITSAHDINKVDIFESQELTNEPQVSVEFQNKSSESVIKFTEPEEIQHENFLKANTQDHNVHNPSNEETSEDYDSNERPPIPIEVEVEIMANANENEEFILNKVQSEISKTQVSIKPPEESKHKQHTLLASAKGVPKISARNKRKATVMPSKCPVKLRSTNKKKCKDELTNLQDIHSITNVNTVNILKKQVVIKLVKLTPEEISNYILGNSVMQCKSVTAMPLIDSPAINETMLENVSISNIANHSIDVKHAPPRGRKAITNRSKNNKTCDTTIYSGNTKSQKCKEVSANIISEKDKTDLKDDSRQFKIPTVNGKRGRKKKKPEEQKFLNEKSEMLNDKKGNLPEQSENNIDADTLIRRSSRKRVNAVKVWNDSFVIDVRSKYKTSNAPKDETLILREHIENNLEAPKVKTKKQVGKSSVDVKQSENLNDQISEDIIQNCGRSLRSGRNTTKCADISSSKMKKQTNMLETLVTNNNVSKVDKDIKNASPPKRRKKISSSLTILTQSNTRASKTKITKADGHNSSRISKNSSIKETILSETKKISDNIVEECTDVLSNDSSISGNEEKNCNFLNSDIDSIHGQSNNSKSLGKNSDLKEFSVNERESQVDFSSNHMQKEIDNSLKVEDEIFSGIQIHEAYSLSEPIKSTLKYRMASQLQDILAEKPDTRKSLNRSNILNDDCRKKYTKKQLKVSQLSNDPSKNKINIQDFKRRKGKEVLAEPVKRLSNLSDELKLQHEKDSSQSQEDIVNISNFNKKIEEIGTKNTEKILAKLNKDKRNSQESLTSLSELNFPKMSLKADDFKSKNRQFPCDSVVPQDQTNANEIDISFSYPSQKLKNIPLEGLAKTSAKQQRNKHGSQDSLLQLPNLKKSKVSPIHSQELMADNKTTVVKSLSLKNAHEQCASTNATLSTVKKSPRIIQLHTQGLLPDKKCKAVKNLFKDMSMSVNKVELQTSCHPEIVGIDSEHLTTSVRSQDQEDSLESSVDFSEPYRIVGKLPNISIVNVKSLKVENEAQVGQNQSSNDVVIFPTYHHVSELPSKEVVEIDYKDIQKSPKKQKTDSEESVLHSPETKKIPETSPSISENIKTNTPRKRKSAIDIGIYELDLSSLHHPLKKPFSSPKKLCTSNVTTVEELTPKKITKGSQNAQCQSQSAIPTDVTTNKLDEAFGGQCDERMFAIIDSIKFGYFSFLGVGSDDVKIQ